MADAKSGGCRCGAIRYAVSGAPARHALCHCEACRRSSGAYVIGWALYPRAALSVEGAPVTYEASPGVTRAFCAACGTGLFYVDEAVFPGMVDLQSATLDAPEALPAQLRIQLADAPAWLHHYGDLPGFARFPDQPA